MTGTTTPNVPRPRWWCALPDTASAAPVTAALGNEGLVAARHRSGRAWIVTHSNTPSPQVNVLGAVSVAVPVAPVPRPVALESAVRSAVDDGEFTPLMAATGGATVVLAEGERLRVVADAAGFHRVFVARCVGVPVLASHADVLRRLVDAPVDRAWLAAKLASPEMPSPVRQNRSPFVGVHPVPAGHVLVVDGHRIRTARWWRAPEPVGGLSDGAAELAEALTQAVGDRLGARAPGRASVQASGGLDSTTLAFLTAAADPLLVTTAGTSPVDDDVVWARRVAGTLGLEHRVVGTEEIPLFFSDLDRPIGAGMDEPCSFTAGGARQRYVATVLAEHSIAVNLNGQGGDEVLLAPLAWLPGGRGAGRLTWRTVCGHAALHGVSTMALLGARCRRRGYPAWLRRTAADLRHPAPTAVDLVGWEAAPLLPPWATREAEQLLAGLLGEVEPKPVHPDAGVHAAVVRIQASAYRARLYADAMTAAGVPTVMPFFDHAVVSACLAVRPEYRGDPWWPKPLLRHAFRDRIPAHLLARRTKGHYNHDLYRGWAAHCGQVQALLADSRLAELDLVDPDRLRTELAAFGPSGLPPGFVTDLVALEVWLRDLDRATAPPSRGRACA
ncbi:asparagine synthase-related protein [Amycolatopsis cihanbeyliensis]|uniref:asparagine synthase (glutamine-hydrolyzing) n=1 Tax=Amycolatopsis cihanbeyliensis TaxID=1128664 RepID=A0A542DDX8_AMYCI|nr:asparagine synthase-related protein [Amycolatopsis cihanbeyliensis]TQJ01270.1 asparagine synthase (glutamine-hydrolysing) [Amycolatopsis cihanbeyliensis]